NEQLDSQLERVKMVWKKHTEKSPRSNFPVTYLVQKIKRIEKKRSLVYVQDKKIYCMHLLHTIYMIILFILHTKRLLNFYYAKKSKRKKDNMMMFGILDYAQIDEGESPEQALQHTVELAQLAELVGFKRFWVAQHHDVPAFASSSPELLMMRLL